MKEVKAKKADIDWWLTALNKEAGYGSGPRYIKQKNGEVKGVGKGFDVLYKSDDTVQLYFTSFSNGIEGKKTLISHVTNMTAMYYVVFGMKTGIMFQKRKKDILRR